MSETPKPLIQVDEALARILEGISPSEIEQVALRDGLNRILAEDIYAQRTQPPFAASAMDGYAVRAQDAVKGGKLTLIGEVAAGAMFKGNVSQGQAVRIFTGAPLPNGTDSILIQENAERLSDNKITVLEPVTSGTYVRPAGLDFSDGDLLLKQGTALTAGALSLAASGNHPTLPVYAKPRIGILATGDELRAPGSTLEPGQIIASNSYGVAAIVEQTGGIPIDLGIAEDSEVSLNNALESAIKNDCSCIVTLGGASVGDHDLVQSTFMAAGMVLDFWKIAMRPGKPLMFGTLNQMRVLGLPGNPVSSLVCSHLFLKPLIAALAGTTHEQPRQVATLKHDLAKNGVRQQYARAYVQQTKDGLEATVFENQDSSILSLYSKANALVIRPINAPACKAGEPVEFIAI